VGYGTTPGALGITCHAGCDAEEVVDALKLTMADLFDEDTRRPECDHTRPWKSCDLVATYDYTDPAGEVLYSQRRYRCRACAGKTFLPYNPATRKPGLPRGVRVLYRLPAVLEAAAAGGTVAVVEGEKDADALAALGHIATTAVNGAKARWEDTYTEALRGAHVVVIADNDPPGRERARATAAALQGSAATVRVLRSPLEKKGADVSDHLAAGLTLEALVDLEDDQPDDQAAPDDDHGQEEPDARRLVLTPASSIRIRRVRWLWDTTPDGAPPTSHGRIPMNSMCIAAGGPGLGKSQFAAWMTARITTGTLPGELFGKPRSVIYAATEDSWSYTIAPRLIAAGADLDLVFRIDVADDQEAHARLTLPLDIQRLGKAAEEYGVALLIADPLLSLIDGKINDYRAAEVRQALEPLIAAADRSHFTILGLAHFTKSGAADPLARIAGSGAFGQLIRSAIVFSRVEDTADDEPGGFVMSLEKNNLGRLDLPSHEYAIQPVTVDIPDDEPAYLSRFVLGPETTTSVKEQMQASLHPDADRDTTTDAAAWLRSYLEDMGGSEMAADLKKAGRAAGFSDTALDRAKKKLRITSQSSGFGKEKRAYWHLPEALPKEAA
jgi:5S rRNA maturation endonuclease (ribonuclease M5)